MKINGNENKGVQKEAEKKWPCKFNIGHSVSKIKMELRSSGTVMHFKKPEYLPVGSTDDPLPTFPFCLLYYTSVSQSICVYF